MRVKALFLAFLMFFYTTFTVDNITVTGVINGGIASYSQSGTVPAGTIYAYPSLITSDAFAMLNTVRAAAPGGASTCLILDATALGGSTYAVTTQLTALTSYCTILIKNPATIFTLNQSFATPTNTPASCAVPIGDGSAIIEFGRNTLFGDFVAGSSAKVWDLVCSGKFDGTQESLRIDGITVQGNPSATVMGSLIHLQGIFVGTRISNTQTDLCYANCVEIDAGTTQTIASDLVFDDDNFQDSASTGTYPGAVLTINAVSSVGGVINLAWFGGAIQYNGPHNPLVVINGQGGTQTGSITFYNVDHELRPATPSSYWTNVDPVQITDASNVYYSNLRFYGTTNSTYQVNAVDISQTVSNNDYAITIQGMTVYQSSGFACMVNNTVEGTCETGYLTAGGGSLILPPYYSGGGVGPQSRLSSYVPTYPAANGSIHTNSGGTTGGNNNLYIRSQNTWVAVK